MKRILPIVTLLLSPIAHAIAPHECLLLVNAENPASREVANWFVHLRGVPEVNVVELTPGDEGKRLNIDTNAFRNLVLKPGIEAMQARGLGNQVAAWVYSCGFPAGVRTDPKMSLTGITFTAGQVPQKGILDSGMFRSPYFAGPGEPPPPQPEPEPGQDKLPPPPKALEAGPTAGFNSRQRALARGPTLIPAMVLGSIHNRGSTPEEIIAMLRRSVTADGTNPKKSPVQFLFQDDIRWSCREWQVIPAVRELQSLGIDAKLVNATKPKGPPLLGLWTGIKTVEADQMPTFVPGAIAEHLTSHAATYDDMSQMKLDEWMRRGVAGSAGTVTEPFAIWTKFVHARVYAHYVRGCTMMESLYQAVGSPLQTLFVGDPLVRPFAPALKLTARVRLEKDKVIVEGDLLGDHGSMEYECLINGVLHGRRSGSANREIEAAALPLGASQIRLVARMEDPIGFSVWSETSVAVEAAGVTLTIQGEAERRASKSLDLAVKSSGLSGEITLMKGAISVGRKPAGENVPFTVTTEVLGKGPSGLHAEARTADGRAVRSASVLVWMD
jgi:hypothetical protein